MKTNITEEMDIHKAWKDEAHNVKTVEDLTKFINHLVEDYGHDYGTIVHAMFSGMMATFHAINNSPQGGITGFQASCLGHMFVRKFLLSEDKMYKIQVIDDLLYPQYESKFRKVLKPEIWKKLQGMAQDNLDKKELASEKVIAHWKTIVAGEVPFGFIISDDED